MIFVDTGALVGRYLAADQHHARAKEGWARIASGRLPWCTSDLVLSETFTLLSRFAGGRFAAETGRLLYATSTLLLLRADVSEERTALEIMRKFAEHHMSFCDCMTVAMLRRRKLRQVFGFDRHFAIAGFDLWPE